MEKIRVVEGPKLLSGTASVVGSMSVIHLIRNHDIPEWNPDTEEGYQRAAVPRRIVVLAEDIRKGMTDLPTAILVNRRNLNRDNLVTEGEELYLPLQKNRTDPFRIIDGQHRVKALQQLMEEGFDSDKWANFQIPFVCLLGANEHEEMQQFHIVNSTAKSVKTDLTYSLLKKRSINDPQLIDKMIREGEVWKLEAEGIKTELAKTEIWQNLIRLPNKESKGGMINSSAIVNSLGSALSEGSLFSDLSLKEQVDILDAFWKGIREIFPDAFGGNRKDYTIQKTVGVYTLHTVLPSVLRKIWKERKDHTDYKEYAEILQPALDGLSAENSLGIEVTGIAFWLSGAEGAAGQFSSEQGRNVIIKRIKQGLLN